MLNRFVKFTKLNVHRLHPVLALFLAQLIVHNFLQAHPLVVQKGDQAVVVSPEANYVIAALPKVVHVQFMEDHVAGSAHFYL